MDTIRLNKYIAMCGICSRRDADKLIEQGRVEINGSKATVGATVFNSDVVMVDGVEISVAKEKVVLAFNKPKGVTCSERDEHAEITINEIIDYPQRVTYAGRLDKDSEGLILLSNDGDLINSMMRGANGHEKEYIVKVSKEWTPEALTHMRQGVYLKELDVMTRPCTIEQIGPKTIRMILTQGINRQIRRMCKTEGYEVVSLKRTRVIDVNLANLRPGEYRELSEEEKQDLYSECGIRML